MSIANVSGDVPTWEALTSLREDCTPFSVRTKSPGRGTLAYDKSVARVETKESAMDREYREPGVSETFAR